VDLVAARVEHELRPHVDGPLDYDDSLVPGQIVASVLQLGSVSDRTESELGTAMRWSYGSVFGLWHGILRRRQNVSGAHGPFPIGRGASAI
jgi:hypothetical protein